MASGSSGGLGRLGVLFACGALGGKTDAELLDLFAGGEAGEAAFEALVVRHGPDVLRACRRVLSDPNDAEDAFQATFLVLARRAASSSLGRPGSLGPWLHGVALRVARKARVAAARRRKHEGRAADRPEAGPGCSQDLAVAIREEVERLPEPLRTPVVLCYLEEMTYQGAARRLRVSEGTIRGRLVKARSLLRSRLDRHEELSIRRLPPPWIAATIRSAMAFAPGGAGMPGVPAAVAELMEGVLTMTIVTRWILGAATAAAITLAAGRGTSMAAKGEDRPPGAPPADAKPVPRPAVVRPAEPDPAPVLTLEDAILRLISHNINDRVKWREIPMARADVLATLVVGKPLLTVPKSSVYGVNINHPLDISLKRLSHRGEAKTILEAQFQDAVRNRVDGLYTAYVDVQEARERLRLVEADLAWSDELLAETRRRAEPGRIPAGDVGRIAAYREHTGLRLAEAIATLARTKRALGLLLDLTTAEADRLEVERLRFADQPIPSSDDLVRLALQCRPDLISLRLGVVRSEADVEEARRRADRGADAYVLHQPYAPANITVNDRGDQPWHATVTVPLPRSGGARRAANNLRRSQTINLRRSQRMLAVEEEAIRREVEERHRQYEPCRAEFRDTLIRLQGRRRTFLEARQHRYETGEREVESILRARPELEASERHYLNLLAGYRRKTLALNTAIGMRLFP